MQEVITNVGQVTPKWLTKTLKKQNFLDWSTETSVQEINYTHHTSTWFADIIFLEVRYNRKGTSRIPEQLFLKISKSDLKPADLLYGKREVEFYNLIAKEMNDPPLACCYDAVYSPVSGRSHILLSDLSKTHFQPQYPLPPSKLDCELAMDSLAQFHAYWWEPPQLVMELRKLSLSKLNPLGLPHSLRETERMFSIFIDCLGDRLSVERRRLFEKVLAAWPFKKLSKRLGENRCITLIHNDMHAWNFFYPHNKEQDRVCIIDWHEWDINIGTNDLAEMMVLWWYPDRRKVLEESLVKRYHQQLKNFGVKGYDWEHCWNDYRLSAIRIILYPIWMYMEGRSPTFWWPVLEKGMLAFQDLGCEMLLE